MSNKKNIINESTKGGSYKIKGTGDIIKGDGYSSEHIETFVVFAPPQSPKKIKQHLKNFKKQVQSEYAKYFRRIGDRKLVRQSNFCGPCINLGALLRETKYYYIYAEDAHWHETGIDNRVEKRIKKSNVHLEPCKACKDHLNSNYNC